MGLVSFVRTAVITVTGLFSLNLFVLGVASTGAFFIPVGKKKKQARLQAQSELWDLSTQPLPGFHHKFFEAPDGVNLHYVEGGDTSPGSPLIIFLHGFPDSWFVWHHQLSAPAIQQKAHLIALDLPGHGGSDGFPRASATAILTSVANFIIAQKEKKTSETCILVSHDWGSIVCCRLAPEIGFLFTRCIVLNGLHPPLAIENMNRATSSASRMLRTYVRNPTNFALIRSAFQSLKPFLNQMKASYYASVFLLPLPLARTLYTMGDFWFLRLLCKLSKSSNEEIFLASAFGPSKSEAEGYPAAILARQNANKRASDRIAYYRDNLSLGTWRKPENIQLLIAESQTNSGFTGLLEQKEGSFKCPVTIVYGAKDTAFHRPFCFEGLEEYLVPPKGKTGKSYLICFPRDGHWTMIPSPAKESVDTLIESALDGIDGEEMKERVWAVNKDVKFEIEN
ncbi:hypothetical protein TWF102_009509 [Orbilia oligospora]|uniref:AB hydrolase-1 domain-containing protein n=1 Tax=Orbilia oligospora TaxID=2813651 RepID=A0A7C8J2J0_ORBOL|nr:hypothetical protein TWF102_009509 [Orbilia oligospora]KAF3093531.1 hypothetical protein TWF706_008766 [Orbilia oligospora]KAF3102440.1 hypothetical protein TWF103_007616 [Orbilia oligospora]KAF3121817.1 hypothetical protein TWF703_001612 [Orbilia oligospora]KAF3141155.1 hypothetical protein TWF594_006186 [Orbilia oligospora]